MTTIGIDGSRANVLQRTGTEWYCYYLLQQFARLYQPGKQRVILYVKSPLVPDLQNLPRDWEVRVLRWPPKLLWTQLRLSLAMLWPWKRPDVLFIPAHTIPIVHPKRTVYVAHDLGFERDASLYANTYIGGIWMHRLVKLVTLGKYGTTELDYHRWSMRYAVQHASQIITISQFTKSELQDCYPVANERISVVYNGYDHQLYTPASVTATTTPYLFYLGRIERKKNIEHLLAAFRLLKEQYHLPHQLWLAGNRGYGFENYQPTKDIKLLGYISEQDKLTLLREASAFVFPSNYEGFGIPVIEALACGTKVACSDIPPLREIGGSACWYYDQTSPAAMAKVIADCLQADDIQSRQHGIKQAQQFSWERCGQQTWQVLLGQVD